MEASGQAKMTRRHRLISVVRVEKGLWTSADPCQRVLMVIGALWILAGCHLLSCNEDFFILRGREVGAAEHGSLEVPCEGADLAALAREHRGALLHLEDCKVSSSAFSAATPGLGGLRAFGEALSAEEARGTWFKVNLQQYSLDAEEWEPVEEARGLRAAYAVAADAKVGEFLLARELAALVPGSVVPAKQSAHFAPAGASDNLGGQNMQAHDQKLYSGNPQWPRDGDVRVWFTAGDAHRASALAAWSGAELEFWRAPQTAGDYDPLAARRQLGIVAAGAVTAKELLARVAPFSQMDVWPMRVGGFVVIWLGMSLLLFPNHVVPDFCGACCCCRSVPGAAFTTVVTAGASAFYFAAPLVATVVAVVAASFFFAVASGTNFRLCFRRCWKRLRRPWKKAKQRGGGGGGGTPASPEDPSYVSLPGSEWSNSELRFGRPGESGSFSRTIRVVAMATGVGIVMAGPVVRALALVDLFGDYYDAFNLN